MFRSKFKRNNKLNRCADQDKDHIGQFTFPIEDRKGEHVRLIHEALNVFLTRTGRDPISGPEFDNQEYGAGTAKAVRLFKTESRPPILNFQNQIDEIVGRKTVAALDLELPAEPGPDVPVSVKLFIDVVVRFLPGVHGSKRDDAALDGIDLDKTNRRVRSVKAIGRGTSLIRNAARPLVLDVVKEVEEARRTDGFTPGVICIYGSSSGGRVALDLASELSKRNIPIAYIGIQDAAFFPDETKTVPGGKGGADPQNVPDFVQAPEVRADKKQSFFQKFGNHADDGLVSREWTSSMDGQEIHGNVVGFEPVDRSFTVKEADRQNDDLAHDEVIGATNAEVQGIIQKVLADQGP
jgi:hypothetical protein